MKHQYWSIRIFTGLFAVMVFIIVCTIYFLRYDERNLKSAVCNMPSIESWRVVWRTQVGSHPCQPAYHSACGWIVPDQSGGVSALSIDGHKIWKTVLSNQTFEAAALVLNTSCVVASLQGIITALSHFNGKVLWSKQTDGGFKHQPLSGMDIGGEQVVWCVSQIDGQVFCLRLKDGTILWQSKATNRCDGEPLTWNEKLAYGNCDGAVYVFDMTNRMMRGKIVVGENDQIAGGMLHSGNGLLYMGTRQGNLIAVNAETMILLAQVKVSASEAFLKPVLVFNGLIAMGNQEGDVSFWRFEKNTFYVKGNIKIQRAVEQLAAYNNRLFILSRGILSVTDGLKDRLFNIELGDDVYGLTPRTPDALACIADGAVISIEKEAQ